MNNNLAGPTVKRKHVLHRLACVSIAALLIALSVHTNTWAQSVDSCMTAVADQAETICREILDNGSRNADVYWKLSSILYQQNKSDEAVSLLNKALSLHPGNQKLKTLKNLIDSNATEQRQLEAAAKKNERSISKGRLKITCRTKTNAEGLAACRQYLQLTDEDGERIRARMATLEEQFGSTQVARQTTPEIEPTAPEAEIEEIPVHDTQQVAEQKNTEELPSQPDVASIPATDNTPLETAALDTAPKVDAKAVALKQTVRQVQTLLNELGFNAGRPDGVPGSRTRSSLNNFYRQAGLPAQTVIDDNVLAELKNQQSNLQAAQSLLSQSRQAADQGNAERAIDKLEQARRRSNFLAVAVDYRPRLDALLASNNAKASDTQVAIATPKPELPANSGNGLNNVPAETSAIGNSSVQFDQLMARIQVLKQRLDKQQAAGESQMQSLRVTTRAALGNIR